MYNLGNLKLSSMKFNSNKLPDDLSVASVKEREENLECPLCHCFRK